MTGSRQRTLDSALKFSLRAIWRNQETLSFADRERYWERLSIEAEDRFEEAVENRKAVRAEMRKKRAAMLAAAPSAPEGDGGAE
jgi:hypothetical protein